MVVHSSEGEKSDDIPEALTELAKSAVKSFGSSGFNCLSSGMVARGFSSSKSAGRQGAGRSWAN